MKRCLMCNIPLIAETESLCNKCRLLYETTYCKGCNTELKDYKIFYSGRTLCEDCLLIALFNDVEMEVK